MTWYRTGTVTVTNGQTLVTGSGTAWIANAQIGEGLVAPDGRIYEITNIVSDTSLSISPAYLGSTASGQSYTIAPLRGRIAQLLSETSSLLASFATVRDGIGAGLFPDGTLSLPGFRFAADQDTGLVRTGSNQMEFTTGGVSRGQFNAAGQFGTSGNFGAGTYSPLARLHVVGGDARLQNNYSLQFSAPGSDTNIGARYILQSDNNFVLYVRNAAGGDDAIMFVTAGQPSGQHDLTLASGLRNLRPAVDNTIALGAGSNRFTTVFAATGAINTSDEREKQWRGPLNADELRAAKRMAAEIGIFQFLDAIEAKGAANARLHCGVRAQQVFAILEDEGLDWSRYAWCCFDEWDADPESEREAGNRYGIRPDQLALWLIAAQEQRLLALEAAA